MERARSRLALSALVVPLTIISAYGIPLSLADPITGLAGQGQGIG